MLARYQQLRKWQGEVVLCNLTRLNQTIFEMSGIFQIIRYEKSEGKKMNEMKLVFKSRLENEVFARTSVVAFLAPLHLSMETLMEIKTIIAEGVVNAMIHGYEGKEERGRLSGGLL